MTDLPLAYQNLAADYIQKTHDDGKALRGSVYQQAKGNVENVFVKMPVGAGRKSLYVDRSCKQKRRRRSRRSNMPASAHGHGVKT